MELQDRPTAPELLDAVATLLTDDIMPALDHRKRFHVRVAANLLRILEREWTLDAEYIAIDRAVMSALLGVEGSSDELREKLAMEIRSGDIRGREAEFLDALRGITRRKLSITNPGYIRDAIEPVTSSRGEDRE
jgi:hypothetical protein